jgi:hypothetical protein
MMWLEIVGVVSLGLGNLALLGLLAVVKALFCDSSLDADLTDAGAPRPHDPSSRAAAAVRKARLQKLRWPLGATLSLSSRRSRDTAGQRSEPSDVF